MSRRIPVTFSLSILLAALALLPGRSGAQEARRLQPQWWFGGSLGLNLNFYSPGIRALNPSVTSPVPFTEGSGSGLFLAPMVEYRHDATWGGMAALGFDSRSGSFDDVSIPPTGTSSLSTSMSYITLEPSLRVSPFPSDVFLFAGPRLAFNVAKSFEYKQSGQPDVSGDFSGVRGTVISGQIGVGMDFPLTGGDAATQIMASPFFAIHFGQGPRSEETWGLTTMRAGVTVKFASTSSVTAQAGEALAFTVRAPRIIPSERRVQETFPTRNYVFFDEGSTTVPARYVALTAAEAASFHEDQLLEARPKDLTGRSRRQLTVYHNLLNVVGDRMRKYREATLDLLGSSDAGTAGGKQMAESVKRYLVDFFGIDAGRIKTVGLDKPSIPSVQRGATRELELVRPEDRRVEISSSTSELLDPVQIISLQEDPLDSDVLVSVEGAHEMLASWSVEAAGDDGRTQRFGPFTGDQERIPGRAILGARLQGQYTLAMVGETSGGQTVRKEEKIRLVRSDEQDENTGWRFSILFEFDQSKTVSTYNRFLTNEVAPLIPAGGSVIIHGHTDVVGEESYNLRLSRDRASETMAVLQTALAKAGKRNVRFDTYGFGEDVRRAPFENALPEERFYNRTVI
ncbi:MAG TPA: outer membrane beta-barrel protein, partial [Bacteroidota bacterium]|nr:outer membrane beta-barrel protein [Bacteroidota bacterium]